MLRVIVVAAYASVRAGLQALLAEEGFQVAGEASGSAELEELLAGAAPAGVLVDYSEWDGPAVLAVLASRDPVSGLVLLVDPPEEEGEPSIPLARLPRLGWALLHREAGGPEI